MGSGIYGKAEFLCAKETFLVIMFLGKTIIQYMSKPVIYTDAFDKEK